MSPEPSASLSDLLGRDALADAVQEGHRIASQIQGYRIERRLGVGGEGAVFEARTPGGERVALKVVFLKRGSGAPGRARRRIGALEGLAHPGVCAPRRVVAANEAWIVHEMPLVEGARLDEHVLSLPAAERPRRAVELCVAIARALEHCHARGVLHLDVKPQNAIVRPDGGPVLVDFGSAREALAPTLTRSCEAKGTLGFMPPEVTLPGSPVDGRADVFALGMMLHLLVCGRLRPAGEPAQATEVACGIALRGGDAGGEGAARLDAGRLAAALCRATELEVARRFAGAGELAAELDAILRGEPAAAPKRGAGALRWRLGPIAAALLALAGGAFALRPREAVEARFDADRRALLFLDASGGVVRSEPIAFDEPSEVTTDRVGDLLAVATSPASRPGELRLFDVARARPHEGWERPWTLADAAPASWRPFDPFDVTSRSFRLLRPRIAAGAGEGGTRAIIVEARASIWASTGVVRVNLDRSVAGGYFQYGHFQVAELADIDGDGSLDALCIGVNNLVRFEEFPTAENPPAIFALSGHALEAGGRRWEGPPGKPGHAPAFDAPLLFYEVIAPFRLGARVKRYEVAAASLRFEAAERRIRAIASPDGIESAGVVLYLDPTGAALLREHVLAPDAERLRCGDALPQPRLVPLVIEGRPSAPPGRLMERLNTGVRTIGVVVAPEERR